MTPPNGRGRGRGIRLALALVLALALALALGSALASTNVSALHAAAATASSPPVSSPPVSAATATAAAAAGTCQHVDGEFKPATLSIAGMVDRTRILALGRDARGVPLTPPLTAEGRWQLGWDRLSRTRPGGAQGVVRLTAHTYPRDGSHGLALGNRLLARLDTGDRLVLAGPRGQRLCYDVTRRLRVRAERSVPSYYASTGRPRLAILVCSGRRRGPGDWSHRTIWFAEPHAPLVRR